MGADDFMQKPFSFAELRARCKVLERRRATGLVLRHGDLELNRVEHAVTRAGVPVSLTNKEFALLEYLLLHRGRAVSRATLLESVWNMSPEAGTNVVDVYVNYLRRKLHDPLLHRAASAVAENAAEPGEQIIRTVRGQGYSIGLRA
jgi:DNA-binding response OmpR family regulator